MLSGMSDDRRDDYSDLEPIDEIVPPAPPNDTSGIAWGFVAFLLGAVLLAIFVVQNTNEVVVEFLAWDFSMSIGVVIMVVVLVTLTFDQVISLAYRRSKRKKRIRRSEQP